MFEPVIKEHTLQINGKWDQFCCTMDVEGYCPICDGGDSGYSVAVFTIINHTPYTVQKGQNKGKVLSDRKMLFVARRNTVKLLVKQAAKRGGLTGVTFDVIRTNDKDPRVGSGFEFVEKRSMKELASKYTAEVASEADYEKEINYKSSKELLLMGIGKSVPTIGTSYADKGKSTDGLEDEL